MKYKFSLLVIILLGFWIAFFSCGDDDDDDDNDTPVDDDDSEEDDDTADDDDTTDDDDLFDPLDHIAQAWTLAKSGISETPELFTLFQIDGETLNFEVELPEKAFDWTYWFYAEWDEGESRGIWTVVLDPVETCQKICDQDDDNCEVLGRVFLQQEEWSAATTGLSAMVALAAPEVMGIDIRYISLFEDLNPTYDFIGYYLQDEHDVVLLINAETGEIVTE